MSASFLFKPRGLPARAFSFVYECRLGPPAPAVNGFFGEVTSAVCDPVGSMTWAETRVLFGLDDVALKGLLSVKQSGSNAIERTAGIDATFPLPLAAAKTR